MKLVEGYSEAQKHLSERENASLRELAQALGYPPKKAAMLSDMLRGRWNHVSLDTLNDLRIRLDLQPIPRRLAVACSTCGQVHGEGLDCGGQPVADVVILRPGQRVVTPSTTSAKRRPRKRRASIHVSPGTWAKLNEARQAAGLTWEEFLSKLT